MKRYQLIAAASLKRLSYLALFMGIALALWYGWELLGDMGQNFVGIVAVAMGLFLSTLFGIYIVFFIGVMTYFYVRGEL